MMVVGMQVGEKEKWGVSRAARPVPVAYKLHPVDVMVAAASESAAQKCIDLMIRVSV